MEETLIDRAVAAARQAGAEERPVPVKILFQAYTALYPPLEAQRSLKSFTQLIHFHCINVGARFLDERNPLAAAPWMTRPLFQKVGRDTYSLLNDEELARFHRSLKAKDERLFQSEYHVRETLGFRT